MSKLSAPSIVDGDQDVVLAVDFDGTMHRGDLSLVAWRWLLRHRPLPALKVALLMAVRGRAAAKLVMERALEQAAWLPVLEWHEGVLDKILQTHGSGRAVVVVTGSSQKLVQRIIRAKGLDYEVIGTTDPRVNLIAEHKAALLVARWGRGGFDYVGNSRADLKVWRHARRAAVVGNPRFVRRVEALAEVAWHTAFDTPKAWWRRLFGQG